jgi:hypothetical protein
MLLPELLASSMPRTCFNDRDSRHCRQCRHDEGHVLRDLLQFIVSFN